MRKIKCAFLFLVLSLAVPSFAQETASRIIENGGTGKYSAVMLTDASLPTHTIFRPKDINGFKKKKSLSLIVWGMGPVSIHLLNTSTF